MKRAVYLISRFGEFETPPYSEAAQEELVAMGARAVPALIAALAHREHGWQAAMTLYEIGEPARKAVPALLKYARDPKASAETWAARVLGRLGLIDELVALTKKKRNAYAGVVGLSCARPASYVAFAALLDRKERALTNMIGSELSPGSASYEVASTDFDAIAAATTSPHLAIRMDAICALGDLRGADRARSVPVLVARLGDRTTRVRQLALIQLGDCRGHARAAIPQIRSRLKDPVAAVRENAKHALAEIERKRPGR